MFKKLAKQLKNFEKTDYCSLMMSSPMEQIKESSRKSFLKSISHQALDLYEKKSDITKFTRLAVSNPENTSHNKIVDELFGKAGFVDAFDDENIFKLSENERFLRDLGLKN